MVSKFYASLKQFYLHIWSLNYILIYEYVYFINRRLLKISVILLPLLGITWVFGILAVNQESSVFAWIFTVLNSLQVRHA